MVRSAIWRTTCIFVECEERFKMILTPLLSALIQPRTDRPGFGGSLTQSSTDRPAVIRPSSNKPLRYMIADSNEFTMLGISNSIAC